MLSVICSAFAQQTEEDAGTRQQLEQLAEQNNAALPEDAVALLEEYKKQPLHINSASADELASLTLLSALQVQQFISYRRLLGVIVNKYELQAIPGWNPELIRKLLPFIIINDDAGITEKLKARWNGGERRWLIRWGRVLEKSRGYQSPVQPGASFYMGNRDRVLTRYTYNYKNLLQWGMLADKDAGEQFLKGAQRLGFDFYSFHFFARKLGVIQALALGDFTVNFGQGLLQWQSIAFKKSAAVLSVKRQSATLRPYNGAGEYNFHRGIGITVQKNHWQSTVFLSSRKISANAQVDSITGDGSISALQTGGYHRTTSENEDRNSIRQTAAGANLQYARGNWRIGCSAVYYQFSSALYKTSRPYNLFALQGTTALNAAMDYSYTWRNVHYFGELATDRSFNKGLVSGAVLSLHTSVDASLLYRKVSRKYTAVNANAFTENTSPVNEEGLYAGISIRPSKGWQLDAYADAYTFPWLKYRVDAPSVGKDFFLQAMFTPSKQVSVSARYKEETKMINTAEDNDITQHVLPVTKTNLRLQLAVALNRQLSIDHRVELLWYNRHSKDAGEGFLTYFDVAYKPAFSAWAGNLRLQYFETSGYNERLYTYESDLPYSFSVPFYYDKGFRYYLNLNWDAAKFYLARKRKSIAINIGAKWAQTLYADKAEIGSGLDAIIGNKRSEAKLQVIVKH